MPQLKTDYARSKVEQLLSAYFEQELGVKIAKLFQDMEDKVITELETYYDKDVMYQANMDLILTPIHEMHREYYDLLMEYKNREFEKSRDSAKRIVSHLTGFKKKGNIIRNMPNVFKADIHDMLNAEFNRDKLFGTLPVSQQDLADRTYRLSEKTLQRVDQNINNIIAKGYEEGWGIDKVTKDIHKRFDQLKKWEAQRIARTEIHQSHNMGMMKGYNDIGVEYIQWNAAIDGRTRDSHREIHGEIIPMGALFSNNLHYPGDMGGAASEVINCRCVASPFIVPDGYTAPSDKVPFREEDLIATLDHWNQDQLITQTTNQTDLKSMPNHPKRSTLNLSHNSKKPIERPTLNNIDEYLSKGSKKLSTPNNEYQFNKKDKKFMKEWAKEQNITKKTNPATFIREIDEELGDVILKDTYNIERFPNSKDHNIWLKSRALKKYFPNEYETILNSRIKEVDYNRLLPKQKIRLKELIDAEEEGFVLNSKEIKEKKVLEQIAKDKNIYAKQITIDASNGYSAVPEKFIQYHFKDKTYSICLSIEKYDTKLTFERINQLMNKHSKLIKDGYIRITFSSQRGIIHNASRDLVDAISNNMGDVIIFTEDLKYLDDIIAHEGAHNLELGKRIISSDNTYRRLSNKDMIERRNGDIKITEKSEDLSKQTNDKIWISDYAEHPISSKAEDLIEDWAESVSAYENDKEWLKHNYPNRFKYIDAVFKEYERTGKLIIPPKGLNI